MVTPTGWSCDMRSIVARSSSAPRGCRSAPGRLRCERVSVGHRAVDDTAQAHWRYGGEEGPAQWADLDPGPLTTIRFPGGGSTPPRTEGVQWLLARDPLTMPLQIKAFTDAP